MSDYSSEFIQMHCSLHDNTTCALYMSPNCIEIFLPVSTLLTTFWVLIVAWTCLRRIQSSSLQSLAKELVHAVHLGRDAEIDGSVADLDNKTAADIGVDLYMSALTGLI